MRLREIKKEDYELILKLDDAVYPVTLENKINCNIIDSWYSTYNKYGMIYCDDNDENNIVAMAINIPMPIKTWHSLIRGECFENTLDINWQQFSHKKTDEKDNENNDKIVGIHIYHIEVLQRNIVGHGFYKTMLHDLSCIANEYHHRINGFSGYCVTPEGNHLFGQTLKCRNVDDGLSSNILNKKKETNSENSNNNSTSNGVEYNNIKNHNDNNINSNFTNEQEPTSEFIVIDPLSHKRKIVNCSCKIDTTQPFLDQSVQPPRKLTFLSKCNMFYCERPENDTKIISPAWNYI